MTDRVADMTVGELRELIRETMMEFLEAINNNMIDPDEGLAFKPEFAQRLEAYLRDKPTEGYSLEEVAKDLGIDV